MLNEHKLKVFISDTFDPWFNLATEDWIFRDMDPDYKILFLWRNDQTVVIGRFQNPWTECNTDLMEKDQIKLARRQSGGGAVFHDLGNTNFTFMTSKSSFDKQKNNQIILRALKRFNIEAAPSGRNDINVNLADGERKISGSAFKETKDRSFHHGTLLINADLTKLANYLLPHPKKLQSKGITSVRSRVLNLKELNSKIDHENSSQAIIEEFFNEYHSQVEIQYLKYEDLIKEEKLNEHYKRLSDWNWRFGETPSFNHSISEYFAWGLIEVYLEVEKATIVNVKIFSDSLHPELIELIMASLKNVAYNKSAIENVVIELKKELPMFSDYLDEFSNWLTKEIG